MPSADKDVGQQGLSSGTATLWMSQVMLVVKNPLPNAGDWSLIPGFRKVPWSRKWQLTPVSLPREFHGLRNLVGYSSQQSRT